MPTLNPARSHSYRGVCGPALLLLGVLVATAPSREALAQPAPRPPLAAEQNARATLVVIVDPGASGIDPAAVRDAVARELRVTVVDAPVEGALGTLEVTIDAGAGARVRFRDARGKRTIERGVELPESPEGGVDVIALLAGNLARDEARELVEALRTAEAARRAAEQEARSPRTGDVAPPPTGTAGGTPPPAPGGTRAGPTATPSRAPASADGGDGSARLRPGEMARRIRAEVAAEAAPFAVHDARELRTFEAALWSPVALDPHASEHRFVAALSLVYDRIGGVDGFALGLGYEDVEGNARGVVLGAFATRIRGLTQGARFAGLGNFSTGPLRGFEGAGLVNLRNGSVVGYQLSGIVNTAGSVLGGQGALVNVAGHELFGAQLGGFNLVRSSGLGLQGAGLVNVSRAFGGAQVAGLTNWAAGRQSGLQLAGVANVGARTVRGVQLAGVFNRARDLYGVQLGLVNTARDVQGVQIGLVNVARDMRGAGLGLVNLSRNGGVRALVWHDRGAEVNVGVKFRSGAVYSELGWGGDANAPLHAFSAGLGVHFGGRLSLEIDGVYRSEWDFRRTTENDGHAVHQRVKLGYELIPRHLGVFGGSGLRESLSPEGKLRGYEPLSVFGVEIF